MRQRHASALEELSEQLEQAKRVRDPALESWPAGRPPHPRSCVSVPSPCGCGSCSLRAPCFLQRAAAQHHLHAHPFQGRLSPSSYVSAQAPAQFEVLLPLRCCQRVTICPHTHSHLPGLRHRADETNFMYPLTQPPWASSPRHHPFLHALCLCSLSPALSPPAHTPPPRPYSDSGSHY